MYVQLNRPSFPLQSVLYNLLVLLQLFALLLFHELLNWALLWRCTLYQWETLSLSLLFILDSVEVWCLHVQIFETLIFFFFFLFAHYSFCLKAVFLLPALTECSFGPDFLFIEGKWKCVWVRFVFISAVLIEASQSYFALLWSRFQTADNRKTKWRLAVKRSSVLTARQYTAVHFFAIKSHFHALRWVRK